MNIVVCSQDFIAMKAIKCLFDRDGYRIHEVLNIDELYSESFTFNNINLIILNVSIRDHASLLCLIRKDFPSLPIVSTQSKFLFSDYVVASWFGHVWLKEYNSLISGYPEINPLGFITDSRFSGNESNGACVCYCNGKLDENQIQSWMKKKLREKVSSHQAVNIAIDYLATGMQPSDVSEKLQCSIKLVYYYRWKIMQKLNLKHTVIDFIPSLNISMHRTVRCNPGKCKMKKYLA